MEQQQFFSTRCISIIFLIVSLLWKRLETIFIKAIVLGENKKTHEVKKWSHVPLGVANRVKDGSSWILLCYYLRLQFRLSLNRVSWSKSPESSQYESEEQLDWDLVKWNWFGTKTNPESSMTGKRGQPARIAGFPTQQQIVFTEKIVCWTNTCRNIIKYLHIK